MRFPGEAEVQSGGIDRKEDGFGRGGEKGAKRAPRALDLGEMSENFREAHHRDRLHGRDRAKSGGAERRSPEPGRLERDASRAEGVQEGGSQPISGGISGRQDERRKPQTATPRAGRRSA